VVIEKSQQTATKGEMAWRAAGEWTGQGEWNAAISIQGRWRRAPIKSRATIV